MNHCSGVPRLTFRTVAVGTAGQPSTEFFQSLPQALPLYKDVLPALLPLQLLELLPRVLSFRLELQISIKREDSQPFVSSPKAPFKSQTLILSLPWNFSTDKVTSPSQAQKSLVSHLSG